MGLFSKTPSPAPAPASPAAGKPASPGLGAAVADIAAIPAAPAPLTPILRSGATISQIIAPPQQSERQVYLGKMKLRIHQQLVERLEVEIGRASCRERVSECV